VASEHVFSIQTVARVRRARRRWRYRHHRERAVRVITGWTKPLLALDDADWSPLPPISSPVVATDGGMICVGGVTLDIAEATELRDLLTRELRVARRRV
jgi:hypothetical protein